MITFLAEIIEVKVKKLVSGDKEYQVRIVSGEPQAIQLDEFVGADRVVKISIGEE
ncbi:MAG: hypothetical protein M3P98_04425 [bacterium]|nr:hypothetical protein [bacterium]